MKHSQFEALVPTVTFATCDMGRPGTAIEENAVFFEPSRLAAVSTQCLFPPSANAKPS